MDDAEFERIRGLLAEKLVAAVYDESEKLKGWQYDVSKVSIENETLEDFRRAVREGIEFRARKLKRLAEPPEVGKARRVYTCEGCSTHIEKGQTVVMLDGRRLCFLCAVVVSALKAGMAKELHRRILDQAKVNA